MTWLSSPHARGSLRQMDNQTSSQESDEAFTQLVDLVDPDGAQENEDEQHCLSSPGGPPESSGLAKTDIVSNFNIHDDSEAVGIAVDDGSTSGDTHNLVSDTTQASEEDAFQNASVASSEVKSADQISVEEALAAAGSPKSGAIL